MRNALVMSAIVMLALVAAPVQAEDGNVSQSTLSSLGLGNLEAMSDAEGTQVRGMSSNAFGTGLAVFSAIIVDPNSGAVFTFAATDFSHASDENAGLNAASSATTGTAAASLGQAISINTNGAIFSAVFGAVNVSGTTLGTSP